MLRQILGVIVCVSFLPVFYGGSEKENIEAICSNDACYTVHLNMKFRWTFADARKECANRGGDLVTMQNQEEAGHIYSLLWKFTNTTSFIRPLQLWIGLKLNSCVHESQGLRGFSWITDIQAPKEGQFSNWLTEPKKTCTKKLCVSMKLQMDSADNYKWSDEPCSAHVDGYICKFNFQGMCQRVVLAGPGYVEYDTSFGFKSSSLDLVPHGSSASVSCGYNGELTGPLLFCLKSDESNVYHYQWGNSRLDKKSNGPFCDFEDLGCKYNNGGCEHECVQYPENKSISCTCKDGYVLAADLVSCVYPDHCKPNPCQQNCKNHQYGFKCSCSTGFVLAENKINCNNIKGCLKEECDPRIINSNKNEELESEYNDTTSSNQTEYKLHQTTPISIINVEKDKKNVPKVTEPTVIPSAARHPPSVSSENSSNALRPRSKLLLSILSIRAVFYS